jgi:hypothetical protein
MNIDVQAAFLNAESKIKPHFPSSKSAVLFIKVLAV